MGLVIRQSIFTTIIAYAGAVVGYVNLLYLYPRFLDPEQVGLLRTIQDAAILFSPFAQFGVSLSIFRFYPQFSKDKSSEASFISLVALIALSGFGLFVIVFKLFEPSILSYFQDNAGEIIRYTNIIVWLTFIMMMTAVMEAYSRSLLKTVVPQLLKEVVVRVMMAVLVTLYFLDYMTYDQFIVATVLAWLACLLLLVVYLVSEGNLNLSFKFALIGAGKIKELVRYSLFSFAGAAGLILVGKIDSLMVAAMVGLTSVAVYTTAFYMAAVIEIPKKALTSVAMPLISRAFEKNDLADVHSIYRKTAINQFIAGSILLIGIYINLDSVFTLIPRSEVYEAGKWVVVLVGFGKLADMAFGPSSEIIVLSKYYGFNIILIILLAGLVIVANNIFIPLYGINGAAMGAAMALVAFNAVKYVFIWVKLGIQPFTGATLKLILISAATIAVDLAIPTTPWVIADIVVRSAIATLVFGSAVYFARVSPDANDLLLRLIRRVRSLVK
jgi:O-antigen/teichoic acid export membrane protein